MGVRSAVPPAFITDMDNDPAQAHGWYGPAIGGCARNRIFDPVSLWHCVFDEGPKPVPRKEKPT